MYYFAITNLFLTNIKEMNMIYFLNKKHMQNSNQFYKFLKLNSFAFKKNFYLL